MVIASPRIAFSRIASSRFARLAVGAFAAAALASLAACGGKSPAELSASGQKLLEQKDYAGAVIEFKGALQQQDSVDVRLLLGRALLEGGDPVSAAVELRKAQEAQAADERVVPPLARAMLATGDESRMLLQFGNMQLTDPQAQADLLTSVATARLMQGDKDAAAQDLARARQSAPGYRPAIVLDARLHAASGDFDAALALLNDALAAAPADEGAGIVKGEVLWRGKKDRDAALAAYRQVLTANPKSVGAHSAVITLLSELNRQAEATAQFEQLKKVAPNHPETLFYEVQQLFSKQDYKGAREIIEGLLKRMPDNARVLELAGATDYAQGRNAEAEVALAKALKHAPGLLMARRMLAQTYLRIGQPAKAVEVLQPAIDAPKPDATLLALAGEAWLQVGDLAKSDAAFARAAQVAPDDSRVRTAAALAQAQRGSTAALEQLEVIASTDKGSRADVGLIAARLRQGDLDGTLKAIDGLARKTGDRPVADALRGRVLLFKRDIAGATQAFQAALAKDPQYLPAVVGMASIDLDAGKPDAARKRFEDLIKARPTDYQAVLALADLAARTNASNDEVVALLRRAVATNAGAAAPHLRLIAQLLQTDPTAALTAAREASAALPQNPQIMQAVGRAQLRAGDGQQAVSTYKQLTTMQASDPLRQLDLADALAATRDFDGARRALRRALELKPGLAAAERGLIRVALADKQPDQALALARTMQQTRPKDADGPALEGDIEASRKNWSTAEAAYRKSLRLGWSGEVASRLNATMREQGKTVEADRMAAAWLKERPDDLVLLLQAGDAALAESKWTVAEGYYRRVLALQPRHAIALNNVAWTLMRQGKPGALAMAQGANDAMPGQPALMDTLALALSADNQLPKAIEIQRAAVGRAPTEPTLRLTLAKLLIKSGDKSAARTELEALAQRKDFGGQSEAAALLTSL